MHSPNVGSQTSAHAAQSPCPRVFTSLQSGPNGVGVGVGVGGVGVGGVGVGGVGAGGVGAGGVGAGGVGVVPLPPQETALACNKLPNPLNVGCVQTSYVPLLQVFLVPT
jgi:hypothetical protein